MKTQAITQGALMTALSVIIALLAFYVPILTVLMYLIIALPTIILYKRFGFTVAFIQTLAASFLLTVLLGFSSSILLSAYIIFPGLFLGYTYQQNKGAGYRFIFGYIGFLLAIAIEFLLVQYLTGVSVTEDMVNEMNNIMDTIRNIYSQEGILNGQTGQQITEQLNNVQQTYLMLLPSMILLIPAALSYLNLCTTDLVFKRLKIDYLPIVPITEWRLSNSIKNFLAILILLTFISEFFIHDPSIAIYPETITFLVMVIFTLMGYSFVFWYFSRKDHKKRVFLRILIVFLSIFFSLILMLILILGILDTYVNLRRFFVKEN